MALRISIGQYYPADSPIHRLDPRVKVGCALAIILATFFVQTPLQLAALMAIVALVLAATRVPAGEVVASVGPLAWMLGLLAIFNLLLVRTGDVLVSADPVTITSGGAWSAVLYPVRVLSSILLGAALLLTTTPTEFGDAFDAALAPFGRLGLPAHQLAMVFSLMLRFIPTLAHDASAIVDAQTARGAALGSGPLPRRARAIGSVIVALLASSVRHAEDLARALDARCYEGGSERTHMRPLALHRRDAVAVGATVAAIATLLLLG